MFEILLSVFRVAIAAFLTTASRVTVCLRLPMYLVGMTPGQHSCWENQQVDPKGLIIQKAT